MNEIADVYKLGFILFTISILYNVHLRSAHLINIRCIFYCEKPPFEYTSPLFEQNNYIITCPPPPLEPAIILVVLVNSFIFLHYGKFNLPSHFSRYYTDDEET